MKRIVPVILAMVAVLIISGCSTGLTGSVIKPPADLTPAYEPTTSSTGDSTGDKLDENLQDDNTYNKEGDDMGKVGIKEDKEDDEKGIEFTNDTGDDETEEVEKEESVNIGAAEKRTEDYNGKEFSGVILEYTEGDLIQLSPEAVDPDGDKVTYSFSEPLTEEGRWQTQIGDEGKYLIKVSATDGKLTTEQDVLIIIHRANRPPVIDCKDEAVLNEGETFRVGDYCTITDEDGDDVVVYYSGWPGLSRYTTTYDDAGDHTLLITASDKTHTVKGELKIKVRNKDRAPEFPDDFPVRIVGVEGDIITIDVSGVTDPDGDPLSFTFSEPFNDKGVWKTKLGDAGTYEIDVVANDGEQSTKRRVTVEIGQANTKPVLKKIPDIVVDEGDTIKLPISATDREGDPLTVTITGWMDSDTYTTTYDDAGEYTVKVTVSDGELSTSQVVHITVNDVNRPPVFVKTA